MALKSESVWEVHPTASEYGGFCTGFKKDLIISVQMESNKITEAPPAVTLVESLSTAASLLGQAQTKVPSTDTLGISDLDSAQQLIAKTQARYRDA